ncbi:hypothetical protein O181_071772 [Austropuccinia psidii MF-1]|uniref:Uncharacterized protein n=1 Tax=Austropuccinia psidii MF-1 TaxID=1389203 RepID=A0A9Q3F5T2_9BASI|nr:hypothetical protein [Austropuccinia psidii MF-1]
MYPFGAETIMHVLAIQKQHKLASQASTRLRRLAFMRSGTSGRAQQLTEARIQLYVDVCPNGVSVVSMPGSGRHLSPAFKGMLFQCEQRLHLQPGRGDHAHRTANPSSPVSQRESPLPQQSAIRNEAGRPLSVAKSVEYP